MAHPTGHTHYSMSRDAVNDLALHYLAKMKVLVVREIEREDIEFIAQVSKQLSIVIFTSFIFSFYSYFYFADTWLSPNCES